MNLLRALQQGTGSQQQSSNQSTIKHFQQVRHLLQSFWKDNVVHCAESSSGEENISLNHSPTWDGCPNFPAGSLSPYHSPALEPDSNICMRSWLWRCCWCRTEVTFSRTLNLNGKHHRQPDKNLTHCLVSLSHWRECFSAWKGNAVWQ